MPEDGRTVSQESLKLRLPYFEEKLEEANCRDTVKERRPSSFDNGYISEVANV
jgi:hypothetical protein